MTTGAQILMIGVHIATLLSMFKLINICSDWSCTPNTPQERTDRALVIVAILLPIWLCVIVTNILPYMPDIGTQ